MTAGASGFANVEPLTACGLTVSQVRDAAESLPLVNGVGAYISLHFTQPAAEVVAGGLPGETFDIEALEEEDLDYASGLKVAKTSIVSISYDVARVDDATAAKFMGLLKRVLDDPEQLLLI